VGFEAGGVAACPPVVEYSREFQAQAAEELATLQDGSAVVEMMGDFAVMGEQVRACGGSWFTPPLSLSGALPAKMRSNSSGSTQCFESSVLSTDQPRYRKAQRR
jgi:hypothetical protein